MKKKIAANKKFIRGFLTEQEVNLLKRQIRFNSAWIDRYIQVIDLLVNKEKCPKDADTLLSLRQRLRIMVDESDTFRHVLWKHQQWLYAHCDENLDASSFLIDKIKSRKQALIAQMARK